MTETFISITVGFIVGNFIWGRKTAFERSWYIIVYASALYATLSFKGIGS